MKDRMLAFTICFLLHLFPKMTIKIWASDRLYKWSEGLAK